MAQVKEEQLQIRISKEDKKRIKALAKGKGMDVSTFVLESLLPSPMLHFEVLVDQLEKSSQPKMILAEINDFLCSLSKNKLKDAISHPFQTKLDNYYQNYIAAMIETRCMSLGILIPEWIKDIPHLSKPVFGTKLSSLKLHLLLNAPTAFKARNIFIDSTVGDRV